MYLSNVFIKLHSNAGARAMHYAEVFVVYIVHNAIVPALETA
jgi:hypothetical protein